MQHRQKGTEERSPSSQLLEKKDLKAMRALLEQGADINIQDEKNKDTPLHRSIWYGRFEVFKLLLEKGADVQKKNKYGNMPIHFAAMYGKTDMINCLLEKGADIHSQGAFGDTPLHRAAFNDRLDIVQLLLEKGAHVNETNNIGHTALHEAAGQGHPAVARVLIENGAKINVKDIQGKTALHAASYHAKIPIITILLEAGADVNIINRHDETAIDLAANEEVKQLLLSFQVNNNNNNSPTPTEFLGNNRPAPRGDHHPAKQHTSPQPHLRPSPKGAPDSVVSPSNKTANPHMGPHSKNLIVESPRVAHDYESDMMNDTNQRILMLERENRFLNAQIKQLRGEEIEHFSLEDLQQLKQYQEIALYNTQQQINRTVSMMNQSQYSGSPSNYPYTPSTPAASFGNQSSPVFLPNRQNSLSASSSRSNSYDRLLTSTLPMTSAQSQLSNALRSKSYTNVPNSRQLSATPKSKSFESVAATVQGPAVGSGSSPDSSSGENRRKSSLTNRSTNDLFANNNGFSNLENFLSDAFRPDLEPSRYVQTDPQNSLL